MIPSIMAIIALLSDFSINSLFIISPLLMIMFSMLMYSPLSHPISLHSLISMDSMSVLLMMLSLWVMGLVIMTSEKTTMSVSPANLFKVINITLLLILILLFSVNKLIIFFILFEASLIPILMVIIIWGYQPERLEAGMYLMFYTIIASCPLLVELMRMYSTFYYMNSNNMYTSINTLYPITSMFMILAFLVKLPMYSLHLWLPKAHVEAPVGGSMLLASILLKLGGYGLMRIIMMMPWMSIKWGASLVAMSVVGGASTAILCLRQTDMKKMIAYSSVSHMALVVTGVFAMNSWGWQGAMMMMMAHGLISSALFAMANMSYESTLSRSMMVNTGTMMMSPAMTMWWFIASAANMAAPPFINLISEVMLISSTVTFAKSTAIWLILISFFTVGYSMLLYTTINHGMTSKSNMILLMRPSHFSIMSLHIVPALVMIMSSTHLLSWVQL